LELASLTGIGISTIYFFRAYFGSQKGLNIDRFLLYLLGSQAIFILLSPVRIAGLVDALIPFELVLILCFLCFIMANAILEKAEGAISMAIATAVLIFLTLMDQLIWGHHVGSLLPVHYLTAGYILLISWIMARRSAEADQKVLQLSKDLEETNHALERHNHNLETEVKARTEELVQARKEAYEMELDQMRRDVEALASHDLLKTQLSRNIIDQLQQILADETDPSKGIKSLIAELRSQIVTEDRLSFLQEHIKTINAEFYDRLHEKFPELSKTEREICAYLKLNLSSKDIAILRQTSINTINVTRHRIRKKLGLERDEELEAIIRLL